jgi:hypothetical protein
MAEKPRPRKRKKPRRQPVPAPAPGSTTTTTTADAATDAGIGPAGDQPQMVTSASTTAPAAAASDPAAAQSADEMEAFFGSGIGPALHYDRSQQPAASTGAQPSGA